MKLFSFFGKGKPFQNIFWTAESDQPRTSAENKKKKRRAGWNTSSTMVHKSKNWKGQWLLIECGGGGSRFSGGKPRKYKRG